MAEIITEDDKRIRDLTDYGDLLVTDFIATDRDGRYSASRVTIQKFINFISTRINSPRHTSGATNPDNAGGNNGDVYYKVPADGSSLSVYQKLANVWGLVFTVALGGGGGSSGIASRPFIFTAVDLPDTNQITLDCTGSERPISVLNETTGQTIDFSYEAPNVYAPFGSGTFDLNIIIMGTPAGLPDADPPTSGLSESDPNQFTFTPSEEPTVLPI